jgi:hypothetical protein
VAFVIESGANGIRTRDLLAASQTLSQLSYGPEPRSVAKAAFASLPRRGPKRMTEKSDYSPVVEEPTGKAHKRRARRKWQAFLWGAHAFWIYALVLAAIVLVIFYFAD